ncbi:hypothetical protein [Deinococcus alpinitundrae]|uniref:hypothetical protein n=1 Tax=Deinococcus alpinitundrae TaxID=468913 RepID=UPI00137AEEF8|nr:hypothetical protein [Deinococcus alpinitundrae]
MKLPICINEQGQIVWPENACELLDMQAVEAAYPLSDAAFEAALRGTLQTPRGRVSWVETTYLNAVQVSWRPSLAG